MDIQCAHGQKMSLAGRQLLQLHLPVAEVQETSQGGGPGTRVGLADETAPAASSASQEGERGENLQGGQHSQRARLLQAAPDASLTCLGGCGCRSV